jgi:hypothetical protein
MSEDRHVTVRLRKELVEQIEAFINSKEGRMLGYTSRAKFVADACRRYLAEVRPPYEHLNTYEDHVKLIDYDLRAIITVYFREGGLVYCDFHESDHCPHIDYALGIPEVQKALRKKNWVRKPPVENEEQKVKKS